MAAKAETTKHIHTYICIWENNNTNNNKFPHIYIARLSDAFVCRQRRFG